MGLGLIACAAFVVVAQEGGATEAQELVQAPALPLYDSPESFMIQYFNPQPILPLRENCDEIRGTEYRYQEERDFFLANCIGVTYAPTSQTYAHSGGVEQWRGLVAEIFPAWSVDTVLGIMYCESKGDPYATSGGGHRGLMQIAPSHFDSTYDPYGNLLAAYRISKGGTDWSQWSC